MEDIEESLIDMFPNLTPGTIKSYSSKYRALRNKGINKKDSNNIEKVLDIIGEQKTATLANNLMGILQVNRALGNITKTQEEQFEAVRQELMLEIKNTPVKSRKASDINFEELIEFIDERIEELNPEDDKYFSLKHKLLQNKLMIMIYNSKFMGRGKEWYTMKIDMETPLDEIINSDDFPGNYCTIEMCIFKDYKTSGYGTLVVEVSKDIQEVMLEMLSVREDLELDMEQLFINTFGKPFTQTAWTKAIKKLTGYSINQIRKYNANKGFTAEERVAVRAMVERAKQMGHSLATALEYYYNTSDE